MTTNLIATINGLWTPGTIGPISPMEYGQVQYAAREATRQILGLTSGEVGFYLLNRNTAGQVQRSRWRVAALAGGPSLRMNTTQPHDSQVSLTLRVEPHSELQQVTYGEEADSMPYRGVLAGIVGALLLRNRWGLSEREIVVGPYGTGVFMPLELTYHELYTDVTTKVDYEATKLASYRLVAAVDSSPLPAMWLAEGDVGTQVSYCVASGSDGPAQRWDAGNAAMPEFEPLPEPGW